MIVKAHCPENRRTPKHYQVLRDIRTGLLFGLAAGVIVFALVYWVSGAVLTPGNPFYEVSK